MKFLIILVKRVEVEGMHVIRGNHRVYEKIKLIVADAENGRTIQQFSFGVLCDQFRIRPGIAAVCGTPPADHGFALKLFFPVVVPGGKNSSMKFNCSGFMQKLIFIRHVKRKCFR